MGEAMSEKFVYPAIVPPFRIKAPEAMSLEEARQHFQWFVSQSGARRALLLAAVRATGGEAHRLDYSPQSLIALWQWAKPQASSEAIPPEQLEAFWDSRPEWVRKAGVRPGELTPETQCLAIDIGYYFGEIFIRRCPRVQWALWTERKGPYNKPYLTGFGPPLVPFEPVTACMWAAVKGKSSSDDLYNKWLAWSEDLE